MPIFYNIDYFKADLVVIQGDTIVFSFQVTINDLPFDLSPFVVSMQVRRKDGLLIKDWSSIGLTPAITISTDIFDIWTDGFADIDTLDYDVQVKDPGIGGISLTIMSGTLFVKKQHTV